MGLMHPRNPYKEHPPDFAALARADPEFARHVHTTAHGAPWLDWTSDAAVEALTRTLLWRDFGVRWVLPAGRLCPTVPSRLNYLLWLQDLIGGPVYSLPARTGDLAVNRRPFLHVPLFSVMPSR